MARLSTSTLLNDTELDRLHETTVELLETVGVELEAEEAIAVFADNGAKVDGNRVFIPRKMLEQAIESAPETFTLHGRNEEKSIVIGGDQIRRVRPGAGLGGGLGAGLHLRADVVLG